MIRAKNGDLVRFVLNRVNYQGMVFYIDHRLALDDVYLHIVVLGCQSIYRVEERLTAPVPSPAL